VKRIGLLGGMSWESSLEYYRLVNQEVRERLGGLTAALGRLRPGRAAATHRPLGPAGELLAGEAQSLVAAGAELLVLCTNTMHKVADRITAAVEVPWSISPTPLPRRCAPRG
jgi:aspartate racemase